MERMSIQCRELMREPVLRLGWGANLIKNDETFSRKQPTILQRKSYHLRPNEVGEGEYVIAVMGPIQFQQISRVLLVLSYISGVRLRDGTSLSNPYTSYSSTFPEL